MLHNQIHRPVLAGLLAIAVSGLLASGASARQDAGDPRESRFYENELRNPLTRVGDQITRGDNNSGNDVSAPHHLPEL